MELQYLRAEYIRLINCDTIQDSYELLDMYADYFLKTIRIHHDDEVKSVLEAEAKLVNQMMLTKILHIKQIVSGISFRSNDGVSLNNIVDPTVVACLIRNVYETVGMFNLIYRHSKGVDEKLIVYNLWVVAGLKYRQRFREIIELPENAKKADDEENIIRSLIIQIENTQLYKNLDEPEKDIIQKKIKEKDFKIKFDNNKVTPLHWQSLCDTMGIESGSFGKIYTYFSLYAHPSNVSVFQFGSMFNEDNMDCWSNTNFNLKNLFALLSIFIADYIDLFPRVLEIFEKQPLIVQLVLNAHNTYLRNYDYSINDSWKELG